MSDELPPGPVRLFAVAPCGQAVLEVIALDPYRVVQRTDQLAAAAISAAAEAARTGQAVWITSRDRWHAAIRIAHHGHLISGTPDAPIDAIGRAVNHISHQQHQGATS